MWLKIGVKYGADFEKHLVIPSNVTNKGWQSKEWEKIVSKRQLQNKTNLSLQGGALIDCLNSGVVETVLAMLS